MIRAATIDDSDALWNLACALEACELDREAFYRILADQLADGRHVTLVWTEHAEDSPAQALMNMRVEDQLHHAARVAEIQELVVDPALRGRGVGRQLLAAACQAARNAGCVRIELVTNQRRHDAHRFYEREGMEQTHYGYTLDL